MRRKLSINFSTSAELLGIAEERKPRLTFRARTQTEWKAWRRAMLRGIRRALGTPPPPTPLQFKILNRRDCGDYIREEVVYQSTPRMWVPAYVLVPKNVIGSRRRAPGMLAIHGHGNGSADVTGLTVASPYKANDYAVQAVRCGMVTLAPDLRGFGKRGQDKDQLLSLLLRRRDPDAAGVRRDMCNVQNLKAGLLGYTLMGLQLHDLRRGLDYLANRPEVDKARIGACGLSAGGMMTLFLSALDSRIKAATISGTLTSYKSYALTIETVCGLQVPQGILQLGDLADVACLIAPRPVCFESGSRDYGFLPTVAQQEFRRIRQCYRLLNVPELAVQDLFDGGHEWHGTVSLPLMEKWLTGGKTVR